MQTTLQQCDSKTIDRNPWKATAQPAGGNRGGSACTWPSPRGDHGRGSRHCSALSEREASKGGSIMRVLHNVEPFKMQYTTKFIIPSLRASLWTAYICVHLCTRRHIHVYIYIQPYTYLCTHFFPQNKFLEVQRHKKDMNKVSKWSF